MLFYVSSHDTTQPSNIDHPVWLLIKRLLKEV